MFELDQEVATLQEAPAPSWKTTRLAELEGRLREIKAELAAIAEAAARPTKLKFERDEVLAERAMLLKTPVQ